MDSHKDLDDECCEIVDESGFRVVFHGSIRKNFTAMHITIGTSKAVLPVDFARFLRIYADMLENHENAAVVHDETDEH